MNKRFLCSAGCLLMVAFLVVGAAGLGATAEATDPRYFEFDRSTGTITGYDRAGGSDVVIPSRIDGVEVEIIGEMAFRAKNLTSVRVPDNVKEIRQGAFGDNDLISIEIPDGLRVIENVTFQHNNLTSVEIPDSVEEIGSHAFANNNLTSIEIGGGVDVAGNAFEGKFRQVYENNNKAAGEYVRGDMDSNWHYRGEVGTEEELETTDPHYFEFDRSTGTITGYDTAGGSDVVIPSRIEGVEVEEIGEDALQNYNLTSVEIPESVEVIGEYAFCQNDLTSVKIPDGVEVIGEAAFSMNGLTSVEIGSNVEVIGRMAFSRNNLTSVDIGEGVKVIKEGAFKGSNLTSLDIPDGVEEIGGSAFGYNELTSVKIPSGVDITGDTIAGNFKRVYLDNNKAAGEYLREDTESDWQYRGEIGTEEGERVKIDEKHALIVGISKYKYPETFPNSGNLSYPADDAKTFHKLLLDEALGKFKEDNITLLVNEEATTENITEAFSNLITETNSDDLAVIYYSGHGTQGPDYNNDEKFDNRDEYYVTYDTNLSSESKLLSSGISDDQFGNWLKSISANHIAVFLDSCYSGGATKSIKGMTVPGQKAIKNNRVFDDFDFEDGLVLFSASRENQLSWESKELEQGVFTHYLAKGLRGEADTDDDGTITEAELRNYLKPNVSEYVEENYSTKQLPLMKGGMGYPLVKRRGKLTGEVTYVKESGKEEANQGDYVVIDLGQKDGVTENDQFEVLYATKGAGVVEVLSTKIVITDVAGPHRAVGKVLGSELTIEKGYKVRKLTGKDGE